MALGRLDQLRRFGAQVLRDVGLEEVRRLDDVIVDRDDGVLLDRRFGVREEANQVGVGHRGGVRTSELCLDRLRLERLGSVRADPKGVEESEEDEVRDEEEAECPRVLGYGLSFRPQHGLFAGD